MKRLCWISLIAWFTLIACQVDRRVENVQQPVQVLRASTETLSDTGKWVATEAISPPAPSHDTLAWRTDYSQLRSEIKTKRATFQQAYARADSAQKDSIRQAAAKYLTRIIPEKLLPFWYGTPWDFNGYSNRPREGVIACGYFVSTPLKHIGWPINRYRVAQKDATSIIQTLSGHTQTWRDSNELLQHLQKQPNSLYIVGLTNHVGFLWVKEGEVYFIHSSYHDPVAVAQEIAAESPVFLWSDIYVIGDVMDEAGMLDDWLL
ncbi:MAG: hypothetical protein AAFV07_02885 [Bacteroidota bacterium]